MYRKHIEQLLIEGLKYFLNCDHYLSHHILISALVLLGFAKLLVTRIAKACRVGVLLVGHDLRMLKADMLNAMASLQRMKHANG